LPFPQAARFLRRFSRVAIVVCTMAVKNSFREPLTYQHGPQKRTPGFASPSVQVSSQNAQRRRHRKGYFPFLPPPSLTFPFCSSVKISLSDFSKLARTSLKCF